MVLSWRRRVILSCCCYRGFKQIVIKLNPLGETIAICQNQVPDSFPLLQLTQNFSYTQMISPVKSNSFSVGTLICS
uniref:Uncharacterized protein n=1 Tax=Arundo donax TaxID=35708 RepID=A0A0A9GIX5_ARUDO